MTKIVGIAILRAGKDLPDPIPISMACDLASYGYFQRQVGLEKNFSINTDYGSTDVFFSCFLVIARNYD